MDWLFVLIGMIVWDVIRSAVTVYWTAHKVKKDRKEEQNGHT